MRIKVSVCNTVFPVMRLNCAARYSFEMPAASAAIASVIFLFRLFFRKTNVFFR